MVSKIVFYLNNLEIHTPTDMPIKTAPTIVCTVSIVDIDKTHPPINIACKLVIPTTIPI